MTQKALRLSFTPLLLILMFTAAMAQSGKVPPFRIVQAGGKIFKAENLPQGKPVLIIYFSPECDHCDHLVKQLLKRGPGLKKVSVAMITHLPMATVADFVKRNNLAKYGNFYVGTEGTTYFVRNYYGVVEMPFTALYSRQGELVKKYLHQPEINDLFEKLNHL
ncbi:hypothetical protein EXU57_17305 [Segetibacter sp. 3557_3]|uniref:TlpA family protein disulfide reductase n=1 Tax=Segetibacter sp. 3557_3 TaxID=2547429 RepID=UPI00105895A4|nr:hypothetical protein [Segetibacter sp. 3557_3]TDH23234.1 hypothetical protein EXU57_17305 [Segetibacter sp. 3557_3]